MPTRQFTLFPILGTKTSCPADDPSLLVSMGDNACASHDVGGQNFDLRRNLNSCTKRKGYEAITSALGTYSSCRAIFNYLGETYAERKRIFFDGPPAGTNARPFSFAVNTGLQAPTEGTPTTFDRAGDWGYSAIEYAGYLVVADGNQTPYKWDGTLGSAMTKLIQSGTEYVFRYLEEFQTRIIGAYSTATSGLYEIRYTEPLPALASLTFPVANQLYKPGEDMITGLKKFGSNACILYGKRSINEIVAYPGSTPPFQIVTAINEAGPVNGNSIVATPNAHYFFTTDYGFVEYLGGQNYSIISEDIEDMVEGIYYNYAPNILGRYIAPNRLVWAVPLAGSATLNALLEFDTEKRTWVKKVLALTPTAMQAMPVHRIGGNMGHRLTQLAFGGTTGIIYAENDALNADAGAAIDAYRIEPILDFGDPFAKKRLTEIWFGMVQGGDYSLDVSWRGGDTVKEVLAASWTALSSVSMNSPANPVVYTDKTKRLHQIKWGTNLANELFEVNRIVLKYEMPTKY